MHRLLALLLSSATLLSCVTDDRGEEFDPPTEAGKDDSQRRPTDHGTLAFGAAQIATISTEAGFHAWQFELTGDANIDAWTTYALLGQRRVDTVMYLYKQRPGVNGGPSTWGPYIARNDNDGSRTYSRIKRTLGAGRYRLLVKGYAATTRGRFAIELGCSGTGCVAAQRACVLGDTYQSAFTTPGLIAQNTTILRATDAAQLTQADKTRIVQAVQQSSHTDVTTWQQAIARVDGGEINRTFFVDEAARRMFVAYEYGAGDNSYGAFFNHHSGQMISSIHDGDLQACTTPSEVCELPATFVDFTNNPSYAQNGARYITAASQLEGTEAAQALAALRFVYEDSNNRIANLAAGLAMADEGSLRVVNLFHLATNTDLTAVEFGAGDTSVGLVFFGNSVVVAGQISDSQIENCNFFRANTSAAQAAGQQCRATSECQTGLRCEGVFANAGVCISTTVIPGTGNECNSDAACGNAALICAGATRGGGLCAATWMRGSFADATSTALTDAGTTARSVSVRGLATVDTDVTIKLTIDHPKPSQLRITLANPGGTEAVVFQGTAATTGSSVALNQPVVGFSGDESVNGQWTLRITDMTTGSVGTLRGWTLGVTSRWD
ncbi:MAG: proprotein convertase P-domain-containing protein [Kofleriaceae bacterium]|nr:proprotein convertase P-domain-containing protein [Kofleriaceae bacterium]